MSLITWTDKILSVNAPKFDQQHKMLIEMINQLYTATIQSKEKSVIMSLLLKLEEQCVNHFKDEEELMVQFNYIDIDNHINEHQIFLNKLKDISEEVARNGKLRIDTSVFIKNWFFDMVFEEDKKLFSFLRDNISPDLLKEKLNN